MSKLMVRSQYPHKPSLVPFIVLGLLLAAAVAVGDPRWAYASGILATLFFVLEIDKWLNRVCPHCGGKSVRVVGTGGLWFQEHGDLREERVLWGECSCCGKLAIRRGRLFSSWGVSPEFEETVAPEKINNQVANSQ